MKATIHGLSNGRLPSESAEQIPSPHTDPGQRRRNQDRRNALAPRIAVDKFKKLGVVDGVIRTRDHDLALPDTLVIREETPDERRQFTNVKVRNR